MQQKITDRDEWFPTADGFPRPDWTAIGAWITESIDQDCMNTAWQDIARYWMVRLRETLAGTYALAESTNFLLLSALEEKPRAMMLDFLERTRTRLIRTLGEAAWSNGLGKHVVLRFNEVDDYYRYISHFYPDGDYGGSAGSLVRRGYSHVAYHESFTMVSERQILAHELAHNLVAHLRLPRWLDEALAQAFSADLAGGQPATLDRDLLAQHREYWNADSIQAFWNGASFNEIEGQTVSYSLAAIVLKIIHQELNPPPEAFRRFVKESDWKDGGEAAALEQLDASLGEIAQVFLGEGDWTPNPGSWGAKESQQHEQ